ncbi:hypothetical protein NHX12_011890 [Muraenolepis orangiensis]|uniref:Uncharacterized protein n=1 Tax=Muraenolepis orangiensis TaxID=630683 RepID=A0A9Q0I654_9TELE|nr:hypothetical protein NHX12_011890 [Muraenolepis orangiensis]
MGTFWTFPKSAILFLILHTSSVVVHGDITDGNAEHLKREHSLTKPYYGKVEEVVEVEEVEEEGEGGEGEVS